MKMLTVPLLVCVMMALTGADARRCSADWTTISDRCFLYVPSPMNWAAAERFCHNHGANLASVHSLQEYQAIRAMIQSITHAYPHTWLGGSDATQEGKWLWSDGTPFYFTYWDIGQPDNYQNANCLVTNYGDDKKWDDEPCYESKPFVCAKKP